MKGKMEPNTRIRARTTIVRSLANGFPYSVRLRMCVCVYRICLFHFLHRNIVCLPLHFDALWMCMRFFYYSLPVAIQWLSTPTEKKKVFHQIERTLCISHVKRVTTHSTQRHTGHDPSGAKQINERTKRRQRAQKNESKNRNTKSDVSWMVSGIALDENWELTEYVFEFKSSHSVWVTHTFAETVSSIRPTTSWRISD